MDIRVSKDADKMLGQIYHTYLERRKAGQSKPSAKDFTSDEEWPDAFRKEWSSADGTDTLEELHQAGFVKPNIIGGFTLSDAGVVAMENRFKDSLPEVVRFLAELGGIAAGVIK